jgi:signal transduction histidine kinase/DNA-binding response OmpR family regulator/ligand-binding sensor domain-containing protein
MYFLWLLFLLLSTSLLAQPKGWQEITISDGLSQGMIYDLKQDKKGFIWVATKDGLNRYDGYNFTVFTHDPYNKFSLSSNACSSLLIDRHGRLWIGTLNRGLNLYDERTHRFYHIDLSDPTSPDAGNYEIVTLAEDPEGNIWVGTSQNKLVKVTLGDSLKKDFPQQADATPMVRFNRFSFPLNGLSGGSAPARIRFHRDGQAIVSAARELYRLDWRRPQPNRYTVIRQFGPLATLFQATPDGQQPSYWFGFSADTLIGWQQAKRKVVGLPLTKNFNVYLDTLNDTTVAVATPDFLWLMSPAQLYAQTQLSEQNAFAVLPPNLFGVTKLLLDRTGTIWVGTAGYGLRKFSPRIKQFQTYLPNTSLSHLAQDRQAQIYVRDQFSYGRLDRQANRRVPFLVKSDALMNRSVYLMQDRQGFFWASFIDIRAKPNTHQLVKFSEKWQRLKTYPLPKGTAFGEYGNQTRQDKAGNLWIGSVNGKLLRFDPITETFSVFSYQHLLPQPAAEVGTYGLYLDRSGTGWISTGSGLVRVDHPLTTPTFSIYTNDVTVRESLSNNFVSSTIDDPYEPLRYLWVSTKGGGLERLDKQTGKFRHFTEAQGLPNKVVYGILEDESKQLWMSTNRGLAQFDPRTLKFRNYTKADGLQDDEFNTGSFLKTASGELLFGGVNGLTAFRPKDVSASAAGAVTPVHIIGLRINNEPVAVGAPDGVLSSSIEQTQRLDLSHDQNLLTLEFAVMDFTNSAKNQFRYRLHGIDKGWVEAGTNRFANYAQLPSGTYTFEVEGSTNGDVWNKAIPLIIRIHPPFYRSWWAYLLYFSFLLFVGWQLYRIQKQRWLLQQQVLFEQKEASRLAELDSLKTQFFTNISHEFRTPLTLILGPLTDIKQRFRTENVVTLTEPVIASMERNSNRLLSLINQLLDLSKLEAGQLKADLQLGDLAIFFRTLASSFDSLAQSRQIQFTFTTEPSHYPASFDRDKLEKIVTNLLANAFKFTPAGNQVRLHIDYPEPGSANLLTITVEDSGIGIAPANLSAIFERFYQVDGRSNRVYEGTGIGLALVNELVTVLGGTIAVSSTEGVGTKFTVQLPLIRLEQVPSQTVEWPEPGLISTENWTVLPEPSPPTPITDNILLVIDDNADIRAYVRSVFESSFDVVEAQDGQEGLELATAVLPNLVICDLMMPRLDGFGFCKALKAQEATSHIPVIMLTAKATVDDRIDGFDAGADDYLTKPFNQAEIQARVRNLIEQRRRLLQWFSKDRKKSGEQPSPSALPAAEQLFLDRLAAVVSQHLDDTNFTVEDLAGAVHLSRVQLHRKLKAVAGTTATQLIRDIRLTKAAELLTEGRQSVTQIAYSVGFDNLSYFAKVFQERYGVSPSHYGKQDLSVT